MMLRNLNQEMQDAVESLLALYSEKINGIVLSSRENQLLPNIKCLLIQEIRSCILGVKPNAQGVFHHNDFTMTHHDAVIYAKLNELSEILKNHIANVKNLATDYFFMSIFMPKQTAFYKTLCALQWTLSVWILYLEKELDKEILAASELPTRLEALSTLAPTAPFAPEPSKGSSFFKFFGCGFTPNDAVVVPRFIRRIQ